MVVNKRLFFSNSLLFYPSVILLSRLLNSSIRLPYLAITWVSTAVYESLIWQSGKLAYA